MRPIAARIARLGLVAWGATVLVLGSGITALHRPLPLPDPAAAVPTGQFRMVHAMSASCACSGRMMDRLERRGPVPDTDERILLVGEAPDRVAALEARGFAVTVLDEEALERTWGIVSVPSLVIYRPDGTVAYRGAHAPRPQMDPVDTALLDGARRGETLPSLTIFGCAVSRALQQRLDPLGLVAPRR
jgi:hypothetical protein